MSGVIILGKHDEPEQRRLVEVTRSFSFKLNVGNYESRDFFCSQKAQCCADEAEQVSKELHDFCQLQVQKAVAHYQAVLAHRAQKKDERKTA